MDRNMNTPFAQQSLHQSSTFEQALAEHGARLVRLCALIAGDADAAEDLAQETLLIAWRLQHRLHDVGGAWPWLQAIARNVCGRWRRQQGREAAHRAPAPKPDHDDDPLSEIADPDDFVVDLDRDELATLLDRALALLPPDTRDVLIGKYVLESSHAELAARLGVSPGALAMRLQRGRLAFGRVLAEDLRDEAAAFGLVDTGQATWQQTRWWCPLCGEQQLRGRLDHDGRVLWLQCTRCEGQPGGLTIQSDHRDLFRDVKTLKRAYNWLSQWSHRYYANALAHRSAACLHCGKTARLFDGFPAHAPMQHHRVRGVHLRCDHCASAWYSSLNGLILHQPQLQQFWRDHGRVRALPPQVASYGNQPALITRIESLTSSAVLHVANAADGLALLGIEGGAA
jgi:RNA polymerase sigma factor (sigma-70 family)